MTTPFSIQRLILNMHNIKKDFTIGKSKFCNEFEKELMFPKSEYSEDIFDFIYNLQDQQKILVKIGMKTIIRNFLDLDFKDPIKVKSFINDTYLDILHLGRDFFLQDLMGFSNDDPDHMNKKFMENPRKSIEKLITVLGVN